MNKFIFCVIGTRAQLIKMAPVMKILESRGIPYRLIFTGQHKSTMRELINEFEIQTPIEYLHEGREISGIRSMMWWMPVVLFRLLRKVRQSVKHQKGLIPFILVHGDTFSTLMGALAGKFNNGKVVHIESGLRSFNLFHPFPEELTRLIVFKLSDIAMCPGKWAFANMEKYSLERVDTGQNTLLDALRFALKKESDSSESSRKDYCVVSLHRFENVFRKKKLLNIIDLLEEIGNQYQLIFVVHPVTKNQLIKYDLLRRLKNNPNIKLVPRMTYIPFIKLLSEAKFVVTDGGSNQEELYYMGIPTLLMRASTERQEGLGSLVTVCNYDKVILNSFLNKMMDRSVSSNGLIESDIQPSGKVVDALFSLPV